jgi:hypothetical protein
MPAFLKGIRKPGEAILVDDLTETLSIGTILPRESLHGGAEQTPLSRQNGRGAGGEGIIPPLLSPGCWHGEGARG